MEKKRKQIDLTPEVWQAIRKYAFEKEVSPKKAIEEILQDWQITEMLKNMR